MCLSKIPYLVIKVCQCLGGNLRESFCSTDESVKGVDCIANIDRVCSSSSFDAIFDHAYQLGLSHVRVKVELILIPDCLHWSPEDHAQNLNVCMLVFVASVRLQLT